MPAPLNHPPYEGCETGGRPRRYSTEDIEKYADEFMVWMKDPLNVWFKDFCLERDIDPDFMSEWSQENKKFNGAYALAKHRQESRLLNGGLRDHLNGSIVKFALANCHGWSDKSETKISGDAANPLAFILQSNDGKTRDLINDNVEE